MSNFDETNLPYDKDHALKLFDTELNPKWIEERKQGTATLKYIGGHIVIRLLNKAFNGAWSFEILEEELIDSLPKARIKWEKQNGRNVKVHETDAQGNLLYDAQPPYVRVKGRMTVPGMGVKEQYGTKVLIGGATEQEHASKAAATDALKKCASLYGVGLELYGDADGLVEGYHNIEDYMQVEQPSYEKEEAPAPTPASKGTKAETPPKFVQDSVEAPVTSSIEQPRSVAEPTEKSVSWAPEDVQNLKRLKQELGITTNAELNPFMAEFFQDPEKTYLDVKPDNVKEVNAFLETKVVRS